MATVSEDDRAEDSHGFSKRYRYYILGILTIVYVFNFIDRQILVILQESIKEDLGLSDAQLGLLSGFAFAIFYVSAPCSRLTLTMPFSTQEKSASGLRFAERHDTTINISLIRIHGINIY